MARQFQRNPQGLQRGGLGVSDLRYWRSAGKRLLAFSSIFCFRGAQVQSASFPLHSTRDQQRITEKGYFCVEAQVRGARLGFPHSGPGSANRQNAEGRY